MGQKEEADDRRHKFQGFTVWDSQFTWAPFFPSVSNFYNSFFFIFFVICATVQCVEIANGMSVKLQGT
jgi:hypothetical protein